MIAAGRIVVGLDDTPGGLAAARFAIDLAAGLGGRVLIVHVTADTDGGRGLVGGTRWERRTVEQRRREARVLLAHMLGVATDAGVAAEVRDLRGEPASVLLGQARDFGADLVVLGRSDRTGPGQPVGGATRHAVTRHVLEFCECPLVVVPGHR